MLCSLWAPLFHPIIGNPLEAQNRLTFFDNGQTEGSVGGTVDFLRWKSNPDVQWGVGITADAYFLMDNSAPTAMNFEALDWFGGVYLSEQTGAFAFKGEWIHYKGTLGDELQQPGGWYYTYYSRENTNLTASFYPKSWLRFYAGLGRWEDSASPTPDNLLFPFAGMEIYSSSFKFLGMNLRGYGTYHLEIDNETSSNNQTIQLGLQFKGQENGQTIRFAVVHYQGSVNFGQLYMQQVDHWGLGVYYDP